MQIDKSKVFVSGLVPYCNLPSVEKKNIFDLNYLELEVKEEIFLSILLIIKMYFTYGFVYITTNLYSFFFFRSLSN
jgi:hypothetical protein